MKTRTEHDFLGEVLIPEGALYGIHTQRAVNNFPDKNRFNILWYKAIGKVKLACYRTYKSFKNAVIRQHPGSTFTDKLFPDEIIEALVKSASEVSEGLHFDSSFLVPAVSGGAGTSIKMNINEIIANRALQILESKPGNYDLVDPYFHANIYQSTNDVIPTGLKLAAIYALKDLEEAINSLRSAVEDKEKNYRHTLRTAYTQMQAAVPSSYGIFFSNYSDALSRDWWRVSRCLERLKVVNLGGNAVGTGLSVPRFFIVQATPTLRSLTGLPLTRSENMCDTTSNLDIYSEVHGTIKALAINMEKLAGDLRLLSSDMTGMELKIPMKQVGSSAMPGKVNPVICEYAICVSHKVYANDNIITTLSAQGCLDLNAYLPVIGDALLNSIETLTGVCKTIETNLIKELEVKTQESETMVYNNPVITTALIPVLGYNEANRISLLMKEKCISVFEALEELKLLSQERAANLLSSDMLLKIGFSIKEGGIDE